jgi:hypothetical protein
MFNLFHRVLVPVRVLSQQIWHMPAVGFGCFRLAAAALTVLALFVKQGGADFVAFTVAGPADLVASVGDNVGCLPADFSGTLRFAAAAAGWSCDATCIDGRFGSGPTNTKYRVVAADPPEACEELRNADKVKGAILLIRRGLCYFHLKVLLGLMLGCYAKTAGLTLASVVLVRSPVS